MSGEGRVGAASVIVEGGKILQLNARQKFPMQSVYKLPIAMAVLADGGAKLDQIVHVDKSEYVRPGQHSPLRDEHPEGADVRVSELLRLAVEESDGSASDVLLRLIGGPETVMKYLRRIGISGITVRDTEKRIGEDWSVQYANWATPGSAVALLSALYQGRAASPPNRELLLQFMTETQTSQTRIKGLLPKGTLVAHKTGSSGFRNGVTGATNDIGIVTLPDGRHMAIAVFVSDSKAGDATRDAVIAKIARTAWEEAVKTR
jgi:beta-lactamase class A